ncbi:MAG TPA: uracil-DNA glycosylase family protein [Baekduia sp.]|nr:uracil-DNA glycosylase family protein [Baekduia sp.]
MRATDDEIREKYLERAIRELNLLAHDIQDCELCPRGGIMPVLGSGHPQADIMLVKTAPVAAEVEEGVAFYGKAGTALMKALKRLQIDPLTVYGTLLCKCPCGDPALADPECIARFREEFAIVQPKLLVVMGDDAVATINDLALPMAEPIDATPGVLRKLTGSCDVLVTTSIDDSLDDETAKRAFWAAFRQTGEWYAAHPPY